MVILASLIAFSLEILCHLFSLSRLDLATMAIVGVVGGNRKLLRVIMAKARKGQSLVVMEQQVLDVE